MPVQHVLKTRHQARESYIELMDMAKAAKKPEQVVAQTMRYLCLHDLYFLLSQILSCAHLFSNPAFNQDWLYERVREVELNPNGYIDIWFREGFKSTISTFGLNIQDVLFDPEITIGIFAFNRPIAKSFLRPIKREFEDNDVLKNLFPDILWDKPEQQSPKWSEDDGIIVKRKGNPKESTIEAWGLVESMPTGRHFNIRDYDDIITEKYVTNEEQVRGATEAWELSLNLGSAVPVRRYGRSNIARYKGTRYALNDPYAEIMRRKTAIPRVYPATHDGTAEGKPVLWSEELLAEKRRDMGPHTFASQLLCNPAADKVQGFDEQWLRYWNPDNFRNMNLYILVDPANAKGKKNDYTTMGVIALGEDQNYRLIDGIRSRLNLTERTDKLFKLHQKYRPMAVGYEEYGMQADKQHIEYEMGLRNYDFKKSLIGLGGNVPKVERIRRLIPVMEQGRFFIPERCFFIDNEQHQQDFSMQIKTEMGEFPVGTHDDILDMLARVLEEKLNAKFPIPGQGGNGGYHGREQTHTDNSSPHYGFKGGNQDGNFVPNHARMIELDENGFFVRGRKPEQTSTDRQSFHNAAWRK